MTGCVARDRLDAAVDFICKSPSAQGRIEMIVSRPAVGEREVLQQDELTIEDGLLGDSWSQRWSGKEQHRQRHLDMQINLMNNQIIVPQAAKVPIDIKSTNTQRFSMQILR